MAINCKGDEMLEFKRIDEDTVFVNDLEFHEIDNPRAILIKYEDWVFDTEACESLLTSDNLRQIADKLDKLNKAG